MPSENQLCDTFGISRPIVREGLAQLKSLGLIEMHSGRTPVVADLDDRLPSLFFEHSIAVRANDITELLEVRRGMERESVRLAASRATADHVSALSHTVEQMANHLTRKGFARFTELDVAFHLSIAEASGNNMLQRLIGAIRGPMRDTIRSGLNARGSDAELERVHVIHTEIVSAIHQRDEAAACCAMEQHFDLALASIVPGKRDAG